MKGFLTTFVMLEATGKQLGIFLFVSFDFPYFVPAPGTESKSSLLWEDFLFFRPSKCLVSWKMMSSILL